jgi:hypothetical protein
MAMDDAGLYRLALGMFRSAINNWNKNKDITCLYFLQGRMEPWLEIAGRTIDDVALRKRIREIGLTPYPTEKIDMDNLKLLESIRITRYNSTTNGVQSHITLPSGRELHGLEPPWHGNLPNISCIPDNNYVLLPWLSPRYGKCFAFAGGTVTTVPEDVPHSASRFLCLMHSANYARQLKGCLAPGTDKDDAGDKQTGGPAVWNSKKALQIIMEEISEPVMCYITWGQKDHGNK